MQHSTQAAPSIRDLAPHVSESLAGVIHRTLDKNPASRFESCAAFAREIVMHAAGIELRESALVVTPETRSVPCPGCGTLLKLLGKYAGKRLRCPTCKITLRVLDDLSLQSFDEPGSLGTMKMNPGTPPSLAVAGTPPEGTTRDPIDTAIIGFATFGIVFVAFLIYLLSSSQKPPEAEIHPPPDIPSKVVQLKPAPQPAEEKRPSRMRLPDGVLVSETFETADIEEGKLPEGWQGDLMVVKKPQDGRMELSLANDQEAGSVTLPFPRDSKVFADFECRVRFLLRENTGKISVNKGKASYLTFSLTNSPGLDHDLFFEVGSTRDFGIIKVFQRPSDSEETAHEMVDPFPMDRASEFVLKRNSDQYEVSINGQIVKKLKFPKYNGPFEHANLALKRPVPEIRPHIVSVSVRAEREPSKRDIAKVSPPRPPFEGTGKSRPNAPAAAPVLAEGFRVDFAGGLMENWESGSLGELKRYSVRKDDKALALAEPGLDLASPFIDHKLDPPITGDFRLKFDLKLPNVASSVAIRLRSGTGALVRIEIQGDDTFSLIAGKESVDNKPMNDVKARNRNGFELQRQGGRFKLSVGGISLANLPSQIGAVSLDGIGVKLSTEYQVVLSPLLYSLDLQPSNP